MLSCSKGKDSRGGGDHQVTLSTRNHFVFLEQFPQRKMIPRELKVQETVEFADQLGQEEAGNGPINGYEGIQEALQGNAELADQPRQEEAANA